MWHQWWAKRSRRRNPDRCLTTQRQCSASRSPLHRLVCHWSRPRNNAPLDIVSLPLTTTPLRNSCRRRLCNSACRWCRLDSNIRRDIVSLRLKTIPLRKSCRQRPCRLCKIERQKASSCRGYKPDTHHSPGSPCRWRCTYQQYTMKDRDTACVRNY